MPRRPEIGNVQLYPDRPLTDRDTRGYVLKYFCPLLQQRVRRSCGTRDRREARKLQRRLKERLLDGSYIESGGKVSELEANAVTVPVRHEPEQQGLTWQECYESYRTFKVKRSGEDRFTHARSRLSIAERIFEAYFSDRGKREGILVREVMTLSMLEYLQERLLEGDESRYDTRSPNTVNSMMGAIMAFVRFCHKREWIDRVPDVENLDVDEVMKGRPITTEEFELLLSATESVVGKQDAASWQFALRVLWFSGFRVGDLMDFHWGDSRHIIPLWPQESNQHPLIQIPSSQKNRKIQQIPMLPELAELLNSVSASERTGWVANPSLAGTPVKPGSAWFQPCDSDLQLLAQKHNNLCIATACGVSEMTIRKWMKGAKIRRKREFRSTAAIPTEEIQRLEQRAKRRAGAVAKPRSERLSKEHVSRVISRIGEEAGIVVRQDDKRTGVRLKYASAHDIRRGCARRLIDAGVSAETLKVVMRHADFATTEKHYGALRSAQSAAAEIHKKLDPHATSDALVGPFVGPKQESPQLDAEEIIKLKSLLERL